MKTPNHREKQGIALVLTLAILAIATILVVAFVSSMRTERQAAASMASNTTAGIIAQTALDHAIATVRQQYSTASGPRSFNGEPY